MPLSNISGYIFKIQLLAYLGILIMYCMFDCKWQVVQKKFLECTATNLPFLFSVYLHLNGIR